MLKISFFGNCQLENIGTLLRNAAQHNEIGLTVLWAKAIYLTKSEEYLALMHALENSDIIYTQYHDTQWGIFSTENLRKSFKLRIVPTLESFVCVPQTSEWNVGPPLASFNIHFQDFRILDLYLKNVPVENVAQQYGDIAPRAGALETEARRTMEKYREYFTSGKVILDYSTVYENAVRQQPPPFYTFNHPTNSQLEWMLNGIMQDIGSPVRITLDGPPMLNQFELPSLLGGANKEYKIMENILPLNLVAKMFYTYFNMIDRALLEPAFRKSSYYTLMDVKG